MPDFASVRFLSRVRFHIILLCAAVLAVSGRAQTAVHPPGAPVISAPAVLDVSVATPFLFPIHATHAPTSYRAAGLPDGLSCDPITGVIGGVTAKNGNFVVTLIATNAAGDGAAIVNMTVTGTTPIEMPFVTRATPPASGAHHAGETLTIEVEIDAPYDGLAVTGAPRIPLTVGDRIRYATYAAQTDGGTRPRLRFDYVIAADDAAPAGIIVGRAIELNGGTIRDRMGLHCALGIPALATEDVRVGAIATESRLHAQITQQATERCCSDSPRRHGRSAWKSPSLPGSRLSCGRLKTPY